jgi:hypothetical protein
MALYLGERKRWIPTETRSEKKEKTVLWAAWRTGEVCLRHSLWEMGMRIFLIYIVMSIVTINQSIRGNVLDAFLS